LLAGAGMNCDKDNTTSAPILFAGTSIHPAVYEGSILTLKIGDNYEASAELTVSLYFALGY
jgi:hypothetical protein